MQTMKLFYSFVIVLYAIVSFSCSNDNNEGNESQKPIKFTSTITPYTELKDKEVVGDWTEGDKIIVFMKKHGEDLSENSLEWKNEEHITYETENGDGVFNPSKGNNDLYFPGNGSAVNFIAYYPHQLAVDTEFNLTVSVKGQGNMAKLDLRYASSEKAHTQTSEAVPLHFERKMSKAEFHLKAGTSLTDADLKGIAISFHAVHTSAQFSLVTGQFTKWDVSTPLSSVNLKQIAENGLFAEVILLPQVVPDDASIYLKLVNGLEFLWDMPNDMELKPGVKYIYEIIVKKDMPLDVKLR